MFNVEYFKKVIISIAEDVERERDYLSKLDSEIGDGDHGINLSIGFRAVGKELETSLAEETSIRKFFSKVGMTLLSKVGGASGPLYGSFFMDLGKAVENEEEVNFVNLIDMLNAGVSSIERRGKAQLEDKTMIDALRPAVDLGLEKTKDNHNLNNDDQKEIFKLMVDAAKDGSDKTIPLIAKKGRALRLKERSIGHRDPGSASSVLILENFYKHL